MDPPTFDQLQTIVDGFATLLILVAQIRDYLYQLFRLTFLASGLGIGCLIWRNFILAKNQRSLW